MLTQRVVQLLGSGSGEMLLKAGIDIALSLVLGYLLGSIPFAYVIGKLRGIDFGKVGDRNVGAFNVFRHAGLVAGIATVIGDVGKGALAIVIAKVLSGNEVVVLAAGAAAFIGHVWPVFLRFRGGVGLGVTMGVFLALFPMQWLGAAPVGIAVLVITRSNIWFALASFVSGGLLGFHFHEFHGDPLLIAYFVVLSCLVGLTLWLKTRHLPQEAQKERLAFWIANKGKR